MLLTFGVLGGTVGKHLTLTGFRGRSGRKVIRESFPGRWMENA